MMTMVKKKVGVTGLLILFILLPGCRDKVAEPVVEQQAITVAFKMPARVDKGPESSDSAKKTPAVSAVSQDKNKTSPAVSVSVVPSSAMAVALPEIVAKESEIPEYTGNGKIDPFMPLIKNEPVRAKEPERPRTPLEMLDYSQMKLVAIVSRGVQRVAMVEETGGKGYIVLVGTYIGRNGGVVSEIRKDRVIVHERKKDFKGDMITHTQEIKLNKTEGKEV